MRIMGVDICADFERYDDHILRYHLWRLWGMVEVSPGQYRKPTKH